MYMNHKKINLPVYLIDFYRKNLSHLKGYKCSYGVSKGNYTCSTYGRKVFLRFPFFTAIKLLRRQFERCRNSTYPTKKSEKVYDICGIPVCCSSNDDGREGCGRL